MIAEMVKVQIAVPQKEEKKLLVWLQEQEVIQLSKIKEGSPEERVSGNLTRKMAHLQFALEFIKRVRGELQIVKKKVWRDTFAGKPTATLACLEQTLAGLKFKELVAQIHKLSDDLTDLQAKQQTTRERIKSLTQWLNLEINGSDLKGTQDIAHELLIVPMQAEVLVKKSLERIPTLVWQEVCRVVEKKKGCIYVEVIVGRSHERQLKEMILQTNAERVDINLDSEKTVAQQVMALKELSVKTRRRRQEVLGIAKKLLKFEKKFQFAYDALLHRQERWVAQQKAEMLSLTTVLTGWMAKHSLQDVKGNLEQVFPNVALQKVAAGKKEVPPVALHNSKLIQPFEIVTNIYGKPKYSELDPSGVLSLFFLVAFGLALTDAGYGIVMMVLTGAAEKFFRMKKEMRKMVRLLFYAGFSTTIFGALTGGWFGINLEAMAAGELRDILLFFKVIDPISQPMTLLLVAFAIGIVQLLFAWVVRAYDHIRKGDLVAFAFDDVAWITMVVVILLWVGSGRGLLPAGWSQRLLVLVLINVGILVLTGGRSFKNPLLKLGGGLLSLYGLISFLSDTLSYSRLLALGLATGIIALVVNLIGSMIVEALPGFGWLIAAVVLLGGHVFNLAINTLGAFIHSGRLQFVEFFPKFIEGGGTTFKPFGRVGRYVDNPNDFN